MPRSTRSEVELLVQEVRAMEMLANEVEVSPERMQDYWATATELVSLATDVQELAAARRTVAPDDAEVLTVRRRIREIAARLEEMSLE